MFNTLSRNERVFKYGCCSPTKRLQRRFDCRPGFRQAQLAGDQAREQGVAEDGEGFLFELTFGH